MPGGGRSGKLVPWLSTLSSSRACAGPSATSSALDGLSFAVAARDAVRLRRAQRGGEDDDDADRLRPARRRTAGRVTWRGQAIDARVRERIGYMPEERGLYPKMRARDQLEYFGVLHGLSHAQARGAAEHGSSGSAWATAPAHGSSSCRRAISSACSSPPRSCTGRTCSCSTSRSPGSIRSSAIC